MKQITEDYVSFEIAKLLKEKGFDIPTENFYDNTGENLKDMKTIYGGTPDFGEVNWNADPFVCEGFPKLITFSKPTQSIVLKWLREVHNIVIEINLEDYMTNENGELQVWYSYTIWTFIRHLGETGLTDSRYDDRAFWQENVKVGQFYEQAVEAALKYALENLI